MFSGFVHLKYSDSRTFVHIGKSTNIYLDEKYSLQIPDSNSPKWIWYKNVSDSWRNLLFVNLAFKAQPVSMLLPSPSAFWLFLRLMYARRKPVYKLCKEPWTLRWKCLFVFSLQAPINDNKACVSLMGIKSTTKKAHIVRAILESIAYRWVSLFLNHTVKSTWLVGELLTWSVNTSKQHESLCLCDFGFVKLCWFMETKSIDAAQGNWKNKKEITEI